MGIKRTKDASELLLARSLISNTAVAFGIEAIDMVCIDFKDSEALSAECIAGFNLGFTGKVLILSLQASHSSVTN